MYNRSAFLKPHLPAPLPPSTTLSPAPHNIPQIDALRPPPSAQAHRAKTHPARKAEPRAGPDGAQLALAIGHARAGEVRVERARLEEDEDGLRGEQEGLRRVGACYAGGLEEEKVWGGARRGRASAGVGRRRQGRAHERTHCAPQPTGGPRRTRPAAPLPDQPYCRPARRRHGATPARDSPPASDRGAGSWTVYSDASSAFSSNKRL